MQINPFLSPCTKLKSKQVKDLHINPYTLKLIEKKLGKGLEHIGTGKNFLNRSPIAYVLRSRMDKWDLIKLQSSCKAKDTLNRTKQQQTNWEKIFVRNSNAHRYMGLFQHLQFDSIDKPDCFYTNTMQFILLLLSPTALDQGLSHLQKFFYCSGLF